MANKPTIKTESVNSADKTNRQPETQPDTVFTDQAKSKTSESEKVENVTTTDARKPFIKAIQKVEKDGKEIEIENEILNPEFISLCQIDYPKAFSKNGLKTVIEAITGSRSEDLPHEEFKVIKAAFKALKEFGKSESLREVTDADVVEIKKKTRIYNDIDRTMEEKTVIHCSTKGEYSSK